MRSTLKSRVHSRHCSPIGRGMTLKMSKVWVQIPSVVFSSINDFVAQLVEHLTVNQNVVGSSPTEVVGFTRSLKMNIEGDMKLIPVLLRSELIEFCYNNVVDLNIRKKSEKIFVDIVSSTGNIGNCRLDGLLKYPFTFDDISIMSFLLEDGKIVKFSLYDNKELQCFVTYCTRANIFETEKNVFKIDLVVYDEYFEKERTISFTLNK